MGYKELINKNIKSLRLKHSLTQEEFAEKIDISIHGLSNIERNRYQPTAETVDKICKAFDITPNMLLLNSADTDEDIINNIVALLSTCKKRQLNKIYDIIKILCK